MTVRIHRDVHMSLLSLNSSYMKRKKKKNSEVSGAWEVLATRRWVFTYLIDFRFGSINPHYFGMPVTELKILLGLSPGGRGAKTNINIINILFRRLPYA